MLIKVNPVDISACWPECCRNVLLAAGPASSCTFIKIWTLEKKSLQKQTFLNSSWPKMDAWQTKKARACRNILSGDWLLDLKSAGLVLISEYRRFSKQCCCAMRCVLWYFLSPWETGSLVILEGGDAVSDCRFLWSAVTLPIPRERVTARRVERGLKCSARYSKRCLINNVSERTRGDAAGIRRLSQAHTHLWSVWSNLSPSPCLQEPPSTHPVFISIFWFLFYSDEAKKRGAGKRCE